MQLPRRIAFAGLLVGIGLTTLTDPSRGQPPAKAQPGLKKEAYVSGESRARVNEMRDGKRSFTNPNDLKGYRTDLEKMAEFLVFRVTHNEFHDPPTATKGGEIRPPATDVTMQSLLEDVNRYVLKPAPGGKFVAEQADYIKEFGVAMDAAIRKVLPPFAPQYGTRPELAVIRLNAARILAVAAQSGAPAHAPTITALLKDEKTKPEVLIYALEAAKNLLAAYDPFKLGDKNQAQHTINDAELYELAKALEAIAGWDRAPWMKAEPVAPPPQPAAAPAPPAPATPAAPKTADAKAADPKAAAAPPKAPADPKAAAPAPPKAADTKAPAPKAADAKAPAPPPAPAGQLENVTEEPLTPEQVTVLRFYRRAAIRALAQVRFPIVRHPNDKGVVYPLWPLAKVAVNDASVAPPTTSDEVAEAVMGLCNYQSFRGVEVDVLLDVIAAGLVNFAGPKANDPNDKSIHWKVYAARLSAALDQFNKTAANNAALSGKAGKINNLVGVAAGNLLSRLERPGVQAPDPTAVSGWRSNNPVPALQPFTDAKGMTLKPAQR